MVLVDERGMHADVDLPVDQARGRRRGGRPCRGRAPPRCRAGRSSRSPRSRRRRASTREWKATVARIAIFAAASAPDTSSVGSASAKPRRCASASASSYVLPPSISVRMKLVVPLTIPRTRWTFVTTSDSRSTLITGIAAQTLASKRSCTPCAGRGGEELGAAPGDELLVGRDDALAAAQQLEHVGAGRLDAAHHLGDDGDRGVVDDLGEVGREHTPSPPAGRVLALLLRGRARAPSPPAGGGRSPARCRPPIR